MGRVAICPGAMSGIAWPIVVKTSIAWQEQANAMISDIFYRLCFLFL